MRFYLASTLANAPAVKALAEELKKAGHVHTYDWTTHGSVQLTPERWQATAEAEMRGVTSADVLIMLHPGQRGTHVELGIAIAKKIPVYIVGTDPAPLTCVFYHLPGVRTVPDTETLIRCLPLIEAIVGAA